MPGVLISNENGCESRTTLGLPMRTDCMGIFVMSMARESEVGVALFLCILWRIYHAFFL